MIVIDTMQLSKLQFNTRILTTNSNNTENSLKNQYCIRNYTKMNFNTQVNRSFHPQIAKELIKENLTNLKNILKAKFGRSMEFEFY